MLPAYFVPANPDQPDETRFSVILSRGEQFAKRFAVPWRRLCKSEFFDLFLYKSWDDTTKPQILRARIMSNPGNLRALSAHVSDKYPHDLVLRIQVNKDKDVKLVQHGDRGYAEAQLKACNLLCIYTGGLLTSSPRTTRSTRIASLCPSTLASTTTSVGSTLPACSCPASLAPPGCGGMMTL